jgi:hypothetical protein
VRGAVDLGSKAVGAVKQVEDSWLGIEIYNTYRTMIQVPLICTDKRAVWVGCFWPGD